MSTPPEIDKNMIDTSRTAMLTFWMARLEATEQQIVEAVETVGPQVEDVKRYLQEKAEKLGPQAQMLDSGFGTLVA